MRNTVAIQTNTNKRQYHRRLFFQKGLDGSSFITVESRNPLSSPISTFSSILASFMINYM
uniref:Uncharacterized protein n=1 Tax=Lepeophtheirus salmonis TaxID=72036 RepID=A0A0K2V129_LEPSM